MYKKEVFFSIAIFLTWQQSIIAGDRDFQYNTFLFKLANDFTNEHNFLLKKKRANKLEKKARKQAARKQRQRLGEPDPVCCPKKKAHQRESKFKEKISGTIDEFHVLEDASEAFDLKKKKRRKEARRQKDLRAYKEQTGQSARFSKKFYRVRQKESFQNKNLKRRKHKREKLNLQRVLLELVSRGCQLSQEDEDNIYNQYLYNLNRQDFLASKNEFRISDEFESDLHD